MKRLIVLLLLLMITAATGSANVELKATPVQSMFTATFKASTPAGSAGDSWNQQAAKEEVKVEKRRVSDGKGRKSVFRAALYSALLPGMGQYYIEHKTRARIFLSVEAVAWIGFASYRTNGGWKRDDMIKFAADQAGADLRGKDKWFEDMVGFYDDVDQYNSRGRVDSPDRGRPYFGDSSTYHWSWQNPRDQATYRTLKNSYREAYRRADFMIGLMVINRIVSVLDAIRGATKQIRQVDGSFGGVSKIRFRLAVNPFSGEEPVRLTIYRRF